MNKKRLKISVYAIMKDEEQFFDRWIESMWDNGEGQMRFVFLIPGRKMVGKRHYMLPLVNLRCRQIT